MFSYDGEDDRLIEMLQLNALLVPKAKEFKASAAATGIPMLYHRHTVPWVKTEQIIESLLNALDEIPQDGLHAFSMMGLGNHLGIMEEKVVSDLVALLDNQELADNERLMLKCCEALGIIGNVLAKDSLTRTAEEHRSPRIRKSASIALTRLGFTQPVVPSNGKR
jgi:hypothetical protein